MTQQNTSVNSLKTKRGRPPKNQPTSIAEFLLNFEKDKNEYLNMRNQYLISRSIAISLLSSAEKRFRLTGLEKRGLGERGRRVLEGYRVGCTDKLDSGKVFTVDLDHDPPRVRVKLANGGWKDLYLKCPVCSERLAVENEELFCTGACASGPKGWAVVKVKEFLVTSGIAVA